MGYSRRPGPLRFAGGVGAFAVAIAAIAAAQTWELPSSRAGAGARSSGDAYVLDGSIGGSNDHVVESPAFRLDAGFLATQAFCGNGVVELGEVCDAGADNGAADGCCAAGCVPKTNGSACSDGNACTTADSCVDAKCAGGAPKSCEAVDECHVAGVCDPSSGLCSTPIAPNGTTCNDGDLCTQTDACQSGVCTGGNPKTCSSAGPCKLAGTCNPATGVCSTPNAADGATCDDGNLCTQDDQCVGGVCAGPTPVLCSALDQCHDAGVCNPGTGLCSMPAKANGSPCTDGNACTQVDSCQSGACAGSQAKTCPAIDQCHGTGTCDPTSGACSQPNKPEGTGCDDGNACTQSDTCASGVCIGGNPVTCPVTDPCSSGGSCNPADGTCSAVKKADGETCDDGNRCTLNDVCQTGQCVAGAAATCAPIDGCHEAGSCDPATGVCSVGSVRTDGTPCSDGNGCTQNDACQSGACVGGPTKVCAPIDQCHDTGFCEPATGACVDPAKANGSVCNDGNQCTIGDACQDGTCVSGASRTCAALDQCHLEGECSPATGACSTPARANGTTCNDGNACTQADECVGGLCVGGDPVACAPLDGCHDAGLCNPLSGACSNPNKADGAACNDGNACTSDDACQQGACTMGAARSCTALDDCHDAGTCDPISGACSNPVKDDGVACSDGSLCTQADSCQGGVCLGGNPIVCEARDQCHDAGACNPASGACSDPMKPAGTPCSVGPVAGTCTTDGTCSTTPPGVVCGNGRLDEGELCDGEECCAPDCISFKSTGEICGTETRVCHEQHQCNGRSAACPVDEERLAPIGSTCSDDNECTDVDTCDAGGGCRSGTLVCGADARVIGEGKKVRARNVKVQVTCRTDEKSDCAATLQLEAASQPQAVAAAAAPAPDCAAVTLPSTNLDLTGNVSSGGPRCRGKSDLKCRRVLKLKLNDRGQELLGCHDLNLRVAVSIRRRGEERHPALPVLRLLRRLR